MYSLEISDYLRLSVIYLWNYKIKKKIDFAGQIVRPFKNYLIWPKRLLVGQIRKTLCIWKSKSYLKFVCTNKLEKKYHKFFFYRRLITISQNPTKWATTYQECPTNSNSTLFGMFPWKYEMRKSKIRHRRTNHCPQVAPECSTIPQNRIKCPPTLNIPVREWSNTIRAGRKTRHINNKVVPVTGVLLLLFQYWNIISAGYGQRRNGMSGERHTRV